MTKTNLLSIILALSLSLSTIPAFAEEDATPVEDKDQSATITSSEEDASTAIPLEGESETVVVDSAEEVPYQTASALITATNAEITETVSAALVTADAVEANEGAFSTNLSAQNLVISTDTNLNGNFRVNGIERRSYHEITADADNTTYLTMTKSNQILNCTQNEVYGADVNCGAFLPAIAGGGSGEMLTITCITPQYQVLNTSCTIYKPVVGSMVAPGGVNSITLAKGSTATFMARPQPGTALTQWVLTNWVK